MCDGVGVTGPHPVRCAARTFEVCGSGTAAAAAVVGSVRSRRRRRGSDGGNGGDGGGDGEARGPIGGRRGPVIRQTEPGGGNGVRT